MRRDNPDPEFLPAILIVGVAYLAAIGLCAGLVCLVALIVRQIP